MSEVLDTIFEKECWDSIIGTRGWTVLLGVMSSRQHSLQREANKATLENDNIGAIKALSKMGEYDKLKGLIKNRLQELNEGVSGE